MDWQAKFDSGLEYHDFLQAHGRPTDQQRWQTLYNQVALTNDQITLLESFTRLMNVLCLAGAWCGDCVNQCPILQRFAEASNRINLRLLDRDQDADVREALSINGGHRVPVVVFLSEDFHECGRYGDRTLSKYRELSQSLLGAACPMSCRQT